jgi:hypothetical protein
VAEWLRRCATSRTVPGSIPGGVTGFFSDIFPSDRSMERGSIQPLMKMSTRNIPGGKGGRCLRLTTSLPSCAECHEIWDPKPPETLWACYGAPLPLPLHVKYHRLSSNWSITWSFRLIQRLYMASCWLTEMQNQEPAGLKQRWIDCVLSVTEWLASNVATRILIRT